MSYRTRGSTRRARWPGLAILLLSTFSARGAEPMVGVTLLGEETYLSLPAEGDLGLVADLDPREWQRYRVRVKHRDAVFADQGWASDDFPPTKALIQVGQRTPAAAPPIHVGQEYLDWKEDKSIQVFIEAKSCQLCPWKEFEARWSY